MPENKIMCSADEYAWLNELHTNSRKALAKLKKIAKPGTVAHDAIPRQERRVQYLENAVNIFQPRPDSVRSADGHLHLSREFEEALDQLSGDEMHFAPIIVDESKVAETVV